MVCLTSPTCHRSTVPREALVGWQHRHMSSCLLLLPALLRRLCCCCCHLLPAADGPQLDQVVGTPSGQQRPARVQRKSSDGCCSVWVGQHLQRTAE